MLPDVHAIFCAGDAAPRQTEELRKQSQGQTPLTHDEGLPVRTILGPLALGPEIVCYDKKVVGTTVSAAHMILNLIGFIVGAQDEILESFEERKQQTRKT